MANFISSSKLSLVENIVFASLTLSLEPVVIYRANMCDRYLLLLLSKALGFENIISLTHLSACSGLAPASLSAWVFYMRLLFSLTALHIFCTFGTLPGHQFHVGLLPVGNVSPSAGSSYLGTSSILHRIGLAWIIWCSVKGTNTAVQILS